VSWLKPRPTTANDNDAKMAINDNAAALADHAETTNLKHVSSPAKHDGQLPKDVENVVVADYKQAPDTVRTHVESRGNLAEAGIARTSVSDDNEQGWEEYKPSSVRGRLGDGKERGSTVGDKASNTVEKTYNAGRLNSKSESITSIEEPRYGGVESREPSQSQAGRQPAESGSTYRDEMDAVASASRKSEPSQSTGRGTDNVSTNKKLQVPVYNSFQGRQSERSGRFRSPTNDVAQHRHPTPIAITTANPRQGQSLQDESEIQSLPGEGDKINRRPVYHTPDQMSGESRSRGKNRIVDPAEIPKGPRRVSDPAAARILGDREKTASRYNLQSVGSDASQYSNYPMGTVDRAGGEPAETFGGKGSNRDIAAYRDRSGLQEYQSDRDQSDERMAVDRHSGHRPQTGVAHDEEMDVESGRSGLSRPKTKGFSDVEHRVTSDVHGGGDTVESAARYDHRNATGVVLPSYAVKNVDSESSSEINAVGFRDKLKDSPQYSGKESEIQHRYKDKDTVGRVYDGGRGYYDGEGSREAAYDLEIPPVDSPRHRPPTLGDHPVDSDRFSYYEKPSRVVDPNLLRQSASSYRYADKEPSRGQVVEYEPGRGQMAEYEPVYYPQNSDYELDRPPSNSAGGGEGRDDVESRGVVRGGVGGGGGGRRRIGVGVDLRERVRDRDEAKGGGRDHDDVKGGGKQDSTGGIGYGIIGSVTRDGKLEATSTATTAPGGIVFTA